MCVLPEGSIARSLVGVILGMVPSRQWRKWQEQPEVPESMSFSRSAISHDRYCHPGKEQVPLKLMFVPHIHTYKVYQPCWGFSWRCIRVSSPTVLVHRHPSEEKGKKTMLPESQTIVPQTWQIHKQGETDFTFISRFETFIYLFWETWVPYVKKKTTGCCVSDLRTKPPIVHKANPLPMQRIRSMKGLPTQKHLWKTQMNNSCSHSHPHKNQVMSTPQARLTGLREGQGGLSVFRMPADLGLLLLHPSPRETRTARWRVSVTRGKKLTGKHLSSELKSHGGWMMLLKISLQKGRQSLVKLHMMHFLGDISNTRQNPKWVLHDLRDNICQGKSLHFRVGQREITSFIPTCVNAQRSSLTSCQ